MLPFFLSSAGCCLFSSSFLWVVSCFFHLFCWVVLLSFSLLWVVLFFPSSSVAWCCFPLHFLGSGASLLSSVGWRCFIFLHWEVLLFFLLLLSCAAWSPPSLGGVAVFPSPFGGAAFPSSGWGCFSTDLFCWVGLLGFPSFGWCCCFTFFCWVMQDSLCFVLWRGAEWCVCCVLCVVCVVCDVCVVE